MAAAVTRPQVLVVEDELVVARDIEQQLADLGYHCVGLCTRGEQAVQMASTLRPDLVLMDIQLAGPMDGIEAASAIRADIGSPVVFLTAFAAEEVIERAKLSEPFGYILKPFTERELRTVLAMALYKHQAEARLRSTTRQLKALSQRVLEAQEQERRRVAMELHDELGQSLTAIKINLQLSQRLQAAAPPQLTSETIRIVEDALQQVRRLATTLRPSMLDDLGLAPALQWMADQTAQRAGFMARFHAPNFAQRLAPEIETACFRITQEALTNITRHAHATTVDLGLERLGEELHLWVQDDGAGFDLAAMQERAQAGGSLGVLGMQERATLLGGELLITSTPTQGTRLDMRCRWRGLEALT
jgi:signal transduction histidine kinase